MRIRPGRSVSVLTSAVIFAGVGVLVAPSALAAAYPVTNTLKDAAGDLSGCVATAAAPTADSSKHLYSVSVSGSCNPAWERLRVDVAVLEVMPNGQQVYLIPRSEIAVSEGDVTDIGAGLSAGCSKGRHELIGRWYPKVKHGVSDPNPYKTTVQARAVVNC